MLDLRNDPGGLLDAAVAISAAFLPENVTVVSTNGQLAESKFTYKAAPEFYQRRAGATRSSACRPPSRTCRWWCWSTKARLRPARSWPAPCRTTSAPPSWAARPSARARCRRCVRSGPDTGLKITTARYYTPSGNSIQANGIVPDVMVDETAEGNLFSALRTREADLDKHLSNGQGAEEG